MRTKRLDVVAVNLKMTAQGKGLVKDRAAAEYTTAAGLVKAAVVKLLGAGQKEREQVMSKNHGKPACVLFVEMPAALVRRVTELVGEGRVPEFCRQAVLMDS